MALLFLHWLDSAIASVAEACLETGKKCLVASGISRAKSRELVLADQLPVLCGAAIQNNREPCGVPCGFHLMPPHETDSRDSHLLAKCVVAFCSNNPVSDC